MKLVKLSLVAAMAAGFMASTASAAPLEELIKDIDASGYSRIRYTQDKNKYSNDGSKSVWEFKQGLDLKTKIDDNFFVVVGGELIYKQIGEQRRLSNNVLQNSTAPLHGDSNGNGTKYRLANFHFGYTVGGTTLRVGRQAIGTMLTDEMFGDGISVVNTDVQGLTLGALFMDTLEHDPDVGSYDLPSVNNKRTLDHNLYGVGAVGSYDPVSFQLWYVAIQDVANIFAGELAFGFDISDDVNIGLTAQAGYTSMDSDYKDAGVADNGRFYAVEASTGLFGFDFAGGYVNYKAKNDGTSFTALEDMGQFIKYGEQLAENYNAYSGKNDYFFVAANYEIPNTDFGFGVEYLDGKNKLNGVKTKNKEIIGRVAYQATEQLKLSSYYSYYTQKQDGTKINNNKELRFEAKYSF